MLEVTTHINHAVGQTILEDSGNLLIELGSIAEDMNWKVLSLNSTALHLLISNSR